MEAFEPFFKAFASILALFYDISGNYAVAIIMLTLVVMLIVTPLTLKGTRSMMVMQQLQPEMRKIQTRYKDDRQKLNEELLKFYKENKINPMGGCLPLLVQMPVFLVLYQVLQGLTRRANSLGADVGWASGQFNLGPLTIAPPYERVFDPKWIQPSTKMYQDLSTSYQMKAFGLDLSESASKAMKEGIGHALPFLALIAIVAVTGFVQQRQMQGRNPNAQVNPQQQMIMKVMPFFLPVISFGLPSGLVLYFAVSNLYRIGQQAFISRSIYGVIGPDGTSSWKHLFGFGLAPKASAKSKSAKAIPAKSRPAPKGAAKSKATASAGAVKGGRTAPDKTSSRGNKGSKAPASPSTRSRPAQPSKPVSGSGATDAPPPMQPRARKKKG
jgi:YidC/Oxa1 family membrane protein insertase